MADLITLTPAPMRVTAPATNIVFQSLWSVVDVLEYDILDLEFGVIGFENPGATPKVTLGLGTSLQRETNDWQNSWVVFGSFLTFTAPNTWQSVRFDGIFLRYIGWALTNTWGTQTAADIWVRGMARKRSEVETDG